MTDSSCPDSALEREALEIIRRAFDEYGASRIGISFNGGKDSVIVLELARRAVSEDTFRQCCIFIIEEDDEFDELIEFRERYVAEHLPGAEVVRVRAASIRAGTWALSECRPIAAAIMGTRRSDPHGAYQRSAIEPTTEGWPQMMRVCPIFLWSVQEVWAFTLREKLPYCALYTSGYTSLGKKSRTLKNENLRDPNGEFRPAWTLTESDQERHGRQ